MLPYPFPDTIGARAATASRSLTASATGRCFSVGKSPTIGERPSLGIGIGMELLELGAAWPCGRFEATQNRIIAVIGGAQGEGGRAERCVIVTGYLRTKFFFESVLDPS